MMLNSGNHKQPIVASSACYTMHELNCMPSKF